MMFHQHYWEEVKRTYSSPVLVSNFKGSSETAEKIAFGFTNVELRCSKCGDIKFSQAIGKAGSPEQSEGAK